jgi:drug/metabolite transporter (DMT)-like permease
MSQDSYNRGKQDTQDSLLNTKNLGMITPESERARKDKYRVVGHSWLISAVACGFCYGFGNLCVVKISHFGFYTRELILFGGFFQALIFLIGRFFYIKHTTGHFWNWENSGFRDPRTDTFRWKAVWAVLLDVVIKVVAGWLVIISFKYALYAGINQGVITTVFTLSSIYVAIMSWFLFDEKLNRFHIVGMLLLIACTILIVFSKTDNKKGKLKIYDQEVTEVAAYVPVGFALITTLIYSFRTIYVKIFVKNLNFNSFDYMTYSYLISGAIFIPFVVFDMVENGFIPEVVFLGMLSGVLNGLGAFFLFYATSYGISGPAYSLKNIEPIVQAIFGSFVFGQYLTRGQFIAI